jgi:hypothetical protein
MRSQTNKRQKNKKQKAKKRKNIFRYFVVLMVLAVRRCVRTQLHQLNPVVIEY